MNTSHFLKNPLIDPFLSFYHYLLALTGALLYRFPSRKIFVIGVTGTKGKTTVIELVNAILEHAGFSTALAGTLRFKIAGTSERNMRKMTMPGRFFIQKFLRTAVDTRCDYAILEMTSEGVKQFRHKFIDLDALIFTNLAPEHIESHGSYENYVAAKLKLARALERSRKRPRIIVANEDDKEGARFLDISVEAKRPFSLASAKPHAATQEGVSLTHAGATITSHLLGEFSIYNILAAVTLADELGIKPAAMAEAIRRFAGVPGRLEHIRAGQDFDVVVDYAHTPDSLAALYAAFPERKKICVLGAAGGGRDRSKRRAMGRIAARECTRVILANEDPYDEDPRAILEEVFRGASSQTSPPNIEIIVDRRRAIRKALEAAYAGDVVLITGKGTDPYIMGPNGTRESWDDRDVVKEELEKLGSS